MILTSAQVKSLEKGLAAVQAALAKIQYLDKLSEADETLKERVQPILSQNQFLLTLANLALELNEQIGEQSS